MHSSGFYHGGSGSIYVGGVLRYDGNALLYFSGRQGRTTRLPNGQPAFLNFTNTKTFLCSRGLNHWGDRIEMHNIEIMDAVRGTVCFGYCQIKTAVFNGRTGTSRVSTKFVARACQFTCYDGIQAIVLEQTKSAAAILVSCTMT